MPAGSWCWPPRTCPGQSTRPQEGGSFGGSTYRSRNRTQETQLRTLLGHQKHSLSSADIQTLVDLTEGFSGSDITALAKDAAMWPLRSLGEALLHMSMDEIRPITLADFEASLGTIRPSVSKAGLKEYEDWAKEFGERGAEEAGRRNREAHHPCPTHSPLAT